MIAEQKKATGLAEEMRVLYVATTRAKNRLILTASQKLRKCRDIVTGGPGLSKRPVEGPVLVVQRHRKVLLRPPSFVPAPNLEIDTLLFALHVIDYVGDMEQEITLSVHEFQERIYFGDSLYKSDYNAEGKFDPEPLAVKSFLPEDGTTVEFLIEDQDFINKWLAVESDTNVFKNDSIFKDYFNGLYITAETSTEEGVMARVQLNNTLSRISLKYANDSTEVDSTAGRDFRWSHFAINEFSSQKINIYEHDHSGTYLSTIIDRPTATTAYSYVQGMAGVNTRFALASLAEWMAKSPISINSASLVFDVVPEEEAGIAIDDLPNRLMLGTILNDNSYEPIYDFLVQRNSQQGSQFAWT